MRNSVMSLDFEVQTVCSLHIQEPHPLSGTIVSGQRSNFKKIGTYPTFTHGGREISDGKLDTFSKLHCCVLLRVSHELLRFSTDSNSDHGCTRHKC